MRESGLGNPPAASHSCQQLPAQDRAGEASPREPSRTPQPALCAGLHSGAQLIPTPRVWERPQSCPPKEQNTSAGALRPGKRLIHLIAMAESSKSLYVGQVPHSTHPQRHFLTHWVGPPPGEKSSRETAGDGKRKGKEKGGNHGSNGPSRKHR